MDIQEFNLCSEELGNFHFKNGRNISLSIWELEVTFGKNPRTTLTVALLEKLIFKTGEESMNL